MHWYALLVFAPFILGTIAHTAFAVASEHAKSGQSRLLYYGISEWSGDMAVTGTVIMVIIASLWH